MKVLEDRAPISAKLMHAVSVLGADLDLLSMDPETILVEYQEYLGRPISDLSRAKLLMGVMAYTTDYCYGDLPTFVEFANYASAETPPMPGVFDPANASECGIAILELAIINNEFEKDSQPEHEFSQEIKAYWGAILASEGLLTTFPPFMDAIIPEVNDFDDRSLFQSVHDNSEMAKAQLQQEFINHVNQTFSLLMGIRDSEGRPLVTQNTTEVFISRYIRPKSLT